MLMLLFVVEGSANTSSNGVTDGRCGLASDSAANVWHDAA